MALPSMWKRPHLALISLIFAFVFWLALPVVILIGAVLGYVEYIARRDV